MQSNIDVSKQKSGWKDDHMLLCPMPPVRHEKLLISFDEEHLPWLSKTLRVKPEAPCSEALYPKSECVVCEDVGVGCPSCVKVSLQDEEKIP